MDQAVMLRLTRAMTQTPNPLTMPECTRTGEAWPAVRFSLPSPSPLCLLVPSPYAVLLTLLSGVKDLIQVVRTSTSTDFLRVQLYHTSYAYK